MSIVGGDHTTLQHDMIQLISLANSCSINWWLMHTTKKISKLPLLVSAQRSCHFGSLSAQIPVMWIFVIFKWQLLCTDYSNVKLGCFKWQLHYTDCSYVRLWYFKMAAILHSSNVKLWYFIWHFLCTDSSNVNLRYFKCLLLCTDSSNVMVWYFTMAPSLHRFQWCEVLIFAMAASLHRFL